MKNVASIQIQKVAKHTTRIVKNQFNLKLMIQMLQPKENRIYIRVEFTRKKCRTAILLYCFHTGGELQIFVLYNLLGPGTSF